MIMSNFIDETERHAELYQAYTPRQQTILEIVEGSSLVSKDDEEVLLALQANHVSDSEIHWLKRTGHYLPVYE